MENAFSNNDTSIIIYFLKIRCFSSALNRADIFETLRLISSRVSEAPQLSMSYILCGLRKRKFWENNSSSHRGKATYLPFGPQLGMVELTN